jgi:hypothetical protein
MTTTKTSRRAIMAGVAAMPIAAIVAKSARASAHSADRKLFAIETEVRDLKAKVHAACDLHTESEEAMAAWASRNPRPKMRETYQAKEREVDDFIRALLAKVKMPDPNADLKAAMAEHEQALTKWSNRRRAAEANCRLDEREAAFNELLDQMSALCEQAEKIPATTIEGLKCKARLVELNDHEPCLALSIANDLLTFQVEDGEATLQ